MVLWVNATQVPARLHGGEISHTSEYASTLTHPPPQTLLFVILTHFHPCFTTSVLSLVARSKTRYTHESECFRLLLGLFCRPRFAAGTNTAAKDGKCRPRLVSVESSPSRNPRGWSAGWRRSNMRDDRRSRSRPRGAPSGDDAQAARTRSTISAA